MELKTITLQDVINHIDSGEAFDIEYCSCDIKRGTAGRIVALAKVRKHLKQVLPKRVEKKEKSEEPKTLTNPNHKYHMTRNLYLQETQEIRKVHLRLITMFNGKRVL